MYRSEPDDVTANCGTLVAHCEWRNKCVLKAEADTSPGSQTKGIILLDHLLFKSLIRKSSANFMWKHKACQNS